MSNFLTERSYCGALRSIFFAFGLCCLFCFGEHVRADGTFVGDPVLFFGPGSGNFTDAQGRVGAGDPALSFQYGLAAGGVALSYGWSQTPFIPLQVANGVGTGTFWRQGNVGGYTQFDFVTVKVTMVTSTEFRCDFTCTVGVGGTCYINQAAGGGSGAGSVQDNPFFTSQAVPIHMFTGSGAGASVTGDFSNWATNPGGSTQPATQPSTQPSGATTQPLSASSFGAWLGNQSKASNRVTGFASGYFNQAVSAMTLSASLGESDYRGIFSFIPAPSGFFPAVDAGDPSNTMLVGLDHGADFYGDVRSNVGDGLWKLRGIFDAFGIRTACGFLWSLLCAWWCVKIILKSLVALAVPFWV